MNNELQYVIACTIVLYVDCNIPYNGNHLRKKRFANFANLEAFVNVFLHFLSWPEFLYMRLPESRKFSRELRQRRQFAKIFFRRWFLLYGINLLRPWLDISPFSYQSYKMWFSYIADFTLLGGTFLQLQVFLFSISCINNFDRLQKILRI